MDENEREKIRKEAKELLKSFAKSLEKVKIGKKEAKVQEGGFRKEGEGKGCDADFRKRMFDNVPSKEGDFVIAEKKKW